MNLVNFKEIKPKIMYYGTPTLLLNTLNEDGSTIISPMSSSWALGDCIVLGIGLGGKENKRVRELLSKIRGLTRCFSKINVS